LRLSQQGQEHCAQNKRKIQDKKKNLPTTPLYSRVGEFKKNFAYRHRRRIRNGFSTIWSGISPGTLDRGGKREVLLPGVLKKIPGFPRDRRLGRPTAPAQGLYLMKINY